MRRALFVMILTCLSFNALAADDSFSGTHWVIFQPIQVAGDIQGCQLTFLTATADRVYLNGNQVAVNGSIVLRATDRALGLALKVGLKNMTSPSSSFERPAFAYLQTASGSTAKSRQQSFDEEPGYKLFVYSATDNDTKKVLLELMASRKVSIVYNRKIGGMDVLVPLDLMVANSEYTQDQKVIRTRSLEGVIGFVKCSERIISRVLD
ncbi:hypothetical protein Mmc1_0604 [Magnetococcus marinus MC-1]|uniref:Uncharacterized protein n=1 Tax=Magnetococcus marinus (strain ATCC BAA-1437 / JCM 17883 / MC-1) TaxID=156889 RepID=A0L582_MAGMM|nr:hypothetical protein [Magnetococcus marinus]ABK43125.1 hypothetical protein Mmc1_0604 [Magnetococcus marinus MC-1]